jgi:hypothetical protein
MSATSSGRICEWQSAIGYAAVTFDHIALSDPTGDRPGIVVCEIPANLKRCDIRETVFSWTPTRFPFQTSSAKRLKIANPPVVTIVGKAFFDLGHAPKDQSTRRSHQPGYAAWEIHPAMALHVVQ